MVDQTSRMDKVLRRRERIVEAAATCFALKGFHQTSMREISAAAGVSLGNLYNHFDSKSDLILEMAKLEEKEDAPLLARLKSMTDPEKAIEEGVKELFFSYQEPLIAALALEITVEATRDEAISESFEKNRKAYCSTLAEQISNYQSAKGTEMSGDIEFLALCILDLVESAAIRQALESESDANTAFEKLMPIVRKLIS
ncbi:TetR family transcriptional regulator [Sneathiella sp. P13V-1]|uniref:TetR/AcrR family transcriptional regulator n=1 Tax=Sneathiella sp. P13V-1 TaxID=2697366 RepID=UPI00187B2145|nr:TetR/AcrR family transcriptional regulator [Sneathiella sp. P13V-1]MBE7636199.1 TetR family transcriptional regulator [Sneathiella sp. P13V-1]